MFFACRMEFEVGEGAVPGRFDFSARPELENFPRVMTTPAPFSFEADADLLSRAPAEILRAAAASPDGVSLRGELSRHYVAAEDGRDPEDESWIKVNGEVLAVGDFKTAVAEEPAPGFGR